MRHSLLTILLLAALPAILSQPVRKATEDRSPLRGHVQKTSSTGTVRIPTQNQPKKDAGASPVDQRARAGSLSPSSPTVPTSPASSVSSGVSVGPASYGSPAAGPSRAESVPPPPQSGRPPVAPKPTIPADSDFIPKRLQRAPRLADLPPLVVPSSAAGKSSNKLVSPQPSTGTATSLPLQPPASRSSRGEPANGKGPADDGKLPFSLRAANTAQKWLPAAAELAKSTPSSGPAPAPPPAQPLMLGNRDPNRVLRVVNGLPEPSPPSSEESSPVEGAQGGGLKGPA